MPECHGTEPPNSIGPPSPLDKATVHTPKSRSRLRRPEESGVPSSTDLRTSQELCRSTVKESLLFIVKALVIKLTDEGVTGLGRFGILNLIVPDLSACLKPKIGPSL